MNMGGPEVFGLFFVGLIAWLVPLAVTVYVLLLLRRMTQALERIDRRLAERGAAEGAGPSGA